MTLYTMKISKKMMIKLKCRHKIDWVSLASGKQLGQQPLMEALVVSSYVNNCLWKRYWLGVRCTEASYSATSKELVDQPLVIELLIRS